MISVAEALDKLFALAPVMEIESVPIRKAAGRVLAQPVTARLTQPPFPASAMDGYAIWGGAIAPGDSFEVIGESLMRQEDVAEATRKLLANPLRPGAM